MRVAMIQRADVPGTRIPPSTGVKLCSATSTVGLCACGAGAITALMPVMVRIEVRRRRASAASRDNPSLPGSSSPR